MVGRSYTTIGALCIAWISHTHSAVPSYTFDLRPITITSERVTITKHPSKPNYTCVRYTNNVSVELGTLCTITAERLVIVLTNLQDYLAPQGKRGHPLEHCLRIVLSGNVIVSSLTRSARAERLTLLPATKQARLSGDISITQSATAENSFAFSLRSMHAMLDLVSFSATLKGSRVIPVRSTVTLAGLLSNKRVH